MLFNICAEHNYIVKIYKDNFIQCICKHSMHQSLKGFRSIAEAKWKYLLLMQTFWGDKSNFMLICRMNGYLVISIIPVSFVKNAC